MDTKSVRELVPAPSGEAEQKLEGKRLIPRMWGKHPAVVEELGLLGRIAKETLEQLDGGGYKPGGFGHRGNA